MIALLARARARIADALDARTLARTVRLLQRQLDHAHLAGQIEEARADRAEERVAELETQLADWREASGELVAESAADLPDLEPADDSGPPSPLPADPYARAEVQAKRADALERHRLAAEAHAADLESELAPTRAQLRQTERSAGAHLATIEDLRARLAGALRAVHVPAVEALQIPGVAAAHEACEDFAHRLAAEAPSKIAGPWRTDEDGDLVRYIIGREPDFAAHVDEADDDGFDGAAWEGCKPTLNVNGPRADVLQLAIDAALRAAGWTLQDNDAPPETQPSERIATREEPRP